MKRFTISVFTEDLIDALSKVQMVFSRRQLKIESLTTSESELKDVYRYTIVVMATTEEVMKVVKQLEKLVTVFKAFYHTDEETIFQEVALYKLRTADFSQVDTASILRKHHAKVLVISQEYTILEKTGYREETEAFLELLAPIGVLEFARSGRVSITKPMRSLSDYLQEIN